MSDHPWGPEPDGVMWTYTGPPGWGRKSIRNDALWAAKVTARLAIIPHALAWRDAAVADGWSMRPTYQQESVERAWRLERDGFVVSGITRSPEAEGDMPTVSIHIWGPDGLVIKAPGVYDFAALVAGTRTCAACGATDVDTQRFSFAGRCCAACRPEMARLHEQPGWTN